MCPAVTASRTGDTGDDSSVDDSSAGDHGDHGDHVDHGDPHPVVRGGVALWTLFLGLALLMIGNGLNLAVLGVRLVGEGFSVRTSGYVMACYFVGFLVGPRPVTKWLFTVGHVRVFAGLATIGATAVLVHAVWIEPAVWALMRFVFGFCMVGLYITVESWLNDATTPRNRGRTLAVYMIVHTGGLGVGQLLIATGDASDFTLFAVASILVSLSFVPMALAATTDAPAVRLAARVGVRDLWRVAPTGLVGMTLIGVATGTLFALGAVYATSAGFGPGRTAAFLAAPALGALLFQWPVGWSSDRFPRRGVIFFVAVAAMGTALGLVLVPTGGAAVVPLMLLLGGCSSPLYSLLLSHTLDWSPPGTAMGASSTLLRANGAGAVVGPIVAASAMGAFGEDAFFWTFVAAYGSVCVYVAWRLAVKEGLPLEGQGEFVSVPARGTDLAVRLAARPLSTSRALLRRKQPL